MRHTSRHAQPHCPPRRRPPPQATPAQQALNALAALLLGILLALLLLHAAEPCPGTSLCAGLALPLPAAWRRWLARQGRRLHASVLRTRAAQLDLLAQSLATDSHPAAGRRFGLALGRAAELRCRAAVLEQQP